MKNNFTTNLFSVLSLCVIGSMLAASLNPVMAAPQPVDAEGQQAALPAAEPWPAEPPAGSGNHNLAVLPIHHPESLRADACYWADLDCDQDIDAGDLSLMAQFWNCAVADTCYQVDLDTNLDGIIDAVDLAALANEYDITPPDIAISTPLPGALLNQVEVAVSGSVSDRHAVSSVTVNGAAAVLAGSSFSAQVTLAPGSQVVEVVAKDEVGASSIQQILVSVDVEGPMIEIHTPKARQSVYSLTPSIQVSYLDYYDQVNPASFQAQLVGESGSPVNITANLSIGPSEAVGVLSTPLQGDNVYTLTVSIADQAGNLASTSASFYVPASSGLTPPAVPDHAGWISGVVFDAASCEGGQEQPVYCDGLAGALVTLSLSADSENPLPGVVVTGPDGFFAFPVGETEQYWLRVEKEGWTYAQREAEVVLERATPVNEIYLTQIDPVSALCTATGCSLESSDGMIRLVIPPGAIPGRDIVEASATFFEQVEFLPSGSLPEGTWETYALNLGGDSEFQFALPITVNVRNTLDFVPGTIIPLGYWNQATQAWEHAGQGVVDEIGEWVVFTTTHFSNYDINAPVTVNKSDILLEDFTEADTICPAEEEICSAVNIRSGALQQEFSLPPVNILGMEVAPTFRYDSQRGNPGEVIEINIGLDPLPGIVLGNYVQAELYIEGEKTDNFTFGTNGLGEGGDIGRFRYLWDGRDAQGRLLPAGVYVYDIRVRIPYRAMYYYSVNNIFGGPPDYTRPFGVYVNATAEKWLHGTVTLDTNPENPFGVGWVLDDWQKLIEDEAGRVLIQSALGMDEYYFPGKNLLLEAAENRAQRELANNSVSVETAFALEQQSYQAALTAPEFVQDPEPKLDEVVPVLTVAVPKTNETSPVVVTEPVSTEPSVPWVFSEFKPEEPVPPTLILRSFPEPATPMTDKSGNIAANETWTLAGSPYILTGDVTVNNGVTLTIEPGVVVMAGASKRLLVQGHLQALGTAVQPILFTSQSNTGPNEWDGLVFWGGSGNTGTGNLSYVTIRYGGDYNGWSYSGLSVVDVSSGFVVLNNCEIAYNARFGTTDQAVWVSNSRFEMNNSTLAYNGDASPDHPMYLTGSTSQIVLNGNTIQNNQRDTILLGTLWSGAVLTPQSYLRGYEISSSFSVPEGYTLTLNPGTVMMGDIGRRLYVQGHLEAVGTLEDPIIFTSYQNTAATQWQGLLFSGGTGHLAHTDIRFGGDYNGISYNGLAAVNVTSGQVLVENSTIHHNSRSTSTDYGVYVANSHFEMVDCTLEFNGDGTLDYPLYVFGTNTVLTLTQNTIQNNQRNTVLVGELWDNAVLNPQAAMHGYEVTGGFVVPAGKTLTLLPGTVMMGDVGRKLYVQGHLEAVGTAEDPIIFTSYQNTGGNQWQGLFFSGGTGHLVHTEIRYGGEYNNITYSGLTAVNVTTGQVLVENSTIHHNSRSTSTDYGVYVANSHFEMVDCTLEFNGDGTLDYPLYVFGTNTVLTLTQNTIQNNQRNTVLVGELWDNAVLNPQAAMHGYEVTGGFVVPAGKTLTLLPGTVMMGDSGRIILIQGHLVAMGTSDNPVIFTSYTNNGPNQWQGIWFDGGTGNLEFAVIRYAGQYNGIAYSAVVARNVSEGRVFFKNVLISNNDAPSTTDSAVVISNANFEMQDSTLSQNGSWVSDVPLQVIGIQSVLTLTQNTIAGNLRDTILVSEYIPGFSRWNPQLEMYGYELGNEFTVPAGATLAIDPGVQVVAGASVELIVLGHLDCLGTPTNPITITSYENNSIGQWEGVIFQGGTGNLQYTTVQRAGGWNGYAYSNITVLNTLTQTVMLENSKVLMGGYLPSTDNGGMFIDNSTVVISRTLFSGNGNGLSDYVLYASQSSAVSLIYSTFQNNAGVPAHMPLQALETFVGNQFFANGNNRIDFIGDSTLQRDLVLSPQGGLSGYTFTGNITVPSGRMFTVSPGLTLSFATSKGIIVNGTLKAVGEDDSPIVFTSIVNTGAGQWQGIQAVGGWVELTWAVVRYANTGVKADNSTLVLKGTEVYKNYNHGLHLTGANTLLTLQMSGIYQNRNFGWASFGLLNETGLLLDARYNWWGSASGPSVNPVDTGGDQVSANVIFQPWLEEPVKDLGITPRTGTDTSTLTFSPITLSYRRTYPDGRAAQFQPDGNLSYMQDPSGNRVAFTYFPDGTIHTMGYVLSGEGSARWLWTFAYLEGKLASITDPAGQIITFEVSAFGDLLEANLGAGVVYQFRYDENHLLTQSIQPGGEVSSYFYDEFGRVQESLMPTRPVYDPITGQAQSALQPVGFTPGDVSYQLVNSLPSGDTLNPTSPLIRGEEIVDMVQQGSGGYSAYTNLYGSQVAFTDALGRTTYIERDEANRVVKEIYPSGRCMEYAYDANGNLATQSWMAASQCSLDISERSPDLVQTTLFTYEPLFNQVKTQTDPMGNTTTYIYDYEKGVGSAGNIVEEILPAPGGRNADPPKYQYTYNAWGLLETVTDPAGVVTRLFYTQGTPDESISGVFVAGVTPVPGLLTRVVRDYGDAAHLNMTTTYTAFNARGLPGKITGSGCCSGWDYALYTYDPMGQLLTETNPNGIVTRYGYDSNGALVQKIQDYTADGTTGRNIRTLFTYDDQGNLLSERTQADGLDVQYSYGYDVDGNLVMEKDPSGATTWYLYDAAGQLLREIAPDGGETTYTYDLDGALETVTDPMGKVTGYTYDPLGRNVLVTYDDGGLNLDYSFGYDANNQLIFETTPTGVKSCIVYDPLGQVIQEVADCDGLNLTQSYQYDLTGSLIEWVDERGVKIQFGNDPLGRMISVVVDPSGLNLQFQYTYNIHDQLLTFRDERGVVDRFSYNQAGQLTSMCEDVHGLNRCHGYAYDRLGNKNAITDPNGIVEQSVVNAFGLITRLVQDAAGFNAGTSWLYNNALQNIRVTDPNGNATQYFYTPGGQVSGVLSANGALVSYSYDLSGQLTRLANQDGTFIDHTYDGAGRLTRKDFSTGGYQTFAYNLDGRLVEAYQNMASHTSRLNFTYNPIGDILETLQTVDGYSWQVVYGYQYSAGQASTQYPSGTQIQTTLDAAGRFTSVSQDGSQVVGYTYNPTAGTVSLNHRNGVVQTITTNPLGHIARIQLKKSTTTLADYEYGYDPAGQRVYTRYAHLPGSPADVYRYDHLYQPVEVWYGADSTSPVAMSSYQSHVQYQLDSLGNRLSMTQDGVETPYGPANSQKLLDPLNRYTQVGGTSLGYDGRYNLTDDGVHSYSYDLLNRQISADGTQYIYDALSRRVAKISGVETTYYIFDQNYQVIEERSAANGLLARYLYGDGVDALLQMERSGSVYQVHRDAQNSVTELTNSTGAVVERVQYDIYGAPTFYNASHQVIPSSVTGNPYLYTGRPYDRETNTYDFRARVYSPLLGRFMQLDPMGFTDGWNLYNSYFVINHTDPTGMDVMGTQNCPGPGFCDENELTAKLTQTAKKVQRRRGGAVGQALRWLGRRPIIREVRIGVRDTVRGAFRELRTIARESKELFRRVVRETIQALRSEFRNSIKRLREDFFLELVANMVLGGRTRNFCRAFLKELAQPYRTIGRAARNQLETGVAEIISRNSENLRRFTPQGFRDYKEQMRKKLLLLNKDERNVVLKTFKHNAREQAVTELGDRIFPGAGQAYYEYRHRHDPPPQPVNAP